jgi:glucans biosynthesis protein C
VATSHGPAVRHGGVECGIARAIDDAEKGPVDATSEVSTREHGLDALRVFAFGLLILYHSCLAYVTWPWLINDPRASHALEPLLLAMNRWRLPLLFFVSGAAATLSLRRRSWLEFAHERAQRLFLPLGVGVFLICPPQTYLAQLVHDRPISYLDLYRSILIPAPAGTMNWIHLWFVGYVLVFSIAGMPLLMLIRSAAGMRIVEAAARFCARWRPAIYLMAVPSFLVAALLGPRWPVTYDLVSDWANLCAGLVLFLWGFIIASSSAWLDLVTARRREFLAVGLAIAAVFFGAGAVRFTEGWPAGAETAFWSAVNSAYAMTWILALVGWARELFTRPSARLSAANRAVYPFYIVHQTVTVVAVYLLLSWSASTWAKLPLVVAATFLVSWAVYELVRRVRWLRPLFGLRSRTSAQG